MLLIITIFLIFITLIIFLFWCHFILVSIHNKLYFQSILLSSIPIVIIASILWKFEMISFSREYYLSQKIKYYLNIDSTVSEEYSNNFLFSSNGETFSVEKYKIESYNEVKINNDFFRYFPSMDYANHKWKECPVSIGERDLINSFISSVDNKSIENEITSLISSEDNYYSYMYDKDNYYYKFYLYNRERGYLYLIELGID